MSGKQSIHRVNGVDINMFEVGRGTPTLLFLHYWGVAIDFRGWGQSSRNTTDYRLDTLADDVIGVIEDLGLHDFSIVGHSMGNWNSDANDRKSRYNYSTTITALAV